MLKIEIFVFSAARTCIENDRIFYLRPAIYAQIMTISIFSKDRGAARVFAAARAYVCVRIACTCVRSCVHASALASAAALYVRL